MSFKVHSKIFSRMFFFKFVSYNPPELNSICLLTSLLMFVFTKKKLLKNF